MKLPARMAPVVSGLLVAVCFAPAVHAAANAAKLQAKYDELSRKYAAVSAGWRPAAPRSGTLLFIASDEYSPLQTRDDATRTDRNQYAEALFNLAKEAAETGQSSLAFQWATETLRENPNYADARQVLGYAERNGKWLTPYGVKMYDIGKVWDSQKGWIAAMPSGAVVPETRVDPSRHADIKNGWQVRTDHFFVTTNHSLAAGVELAERLERLYQIWRQLFAGFYYSEQEVKGLFAADRIARVPVRQFRVFYHRNRADYVNSLTRRQPRIGETLGIYFDANSEAHFFADDKAATDENKESKEGPVSTVNEGAIATLNHEAVHQLFQESKPAARRIGDISNFWVIEGVATYFETLTEHNDSKAGLYYTIGERTAGRLPAAAKLVADNYYVPLADLTKLGKDELQHRDDAKKLYSQSSGLAAFLLNGADGRYREPMVRYLQAVYTRHENDQTLSEVTGTSYPELDQAYRRFMQSLP